MGKSAPESLSIRSHPDQADVTITDEKGTKIFEGKTPTTVALEKKKLKTFTLQITYCKLKQLNWIERKGQNQKGSPLRVVI